MKAYHHGNEKEVARNKAFINNVIVRFVLGLILIFYSTQKALNQKYLGWFLIVSFQSINYYFEFHV